MNRSSALRRLPPASMTELWAVTAATLQSQAGSGFLIVAVTVEALRISGTVSVAPLIVAASGLAPMLLVRPIRRMVRRANPRLLMVVADGGGFVTITALSGVTRMNATAQWHLYAAMFVLSGFAALYLPASREWGARVTRDRDELVALNGVLAIATQLAIVIGWSCGGVLVAVAGPLVAIEICAASYAVSFTLQAIVFSITSRRSKLVPIDVAAITRTVPLSGAWHRMLREGSGALYTYSLLSQALVQRLTFSMFVPLVAGLNQSSSWVAGVANGAFGAFAVVGASLLTMPRTSDRIRLFAPTILAIGFGVQIVFGLSASIPAIAITSFAIVGLLSASASAIQSEAQDRWRLIGAGDAFSILGALQAPMQAGGALVLSAILVHANIAAVYVTCVAVFGFGSVLFAALARRHTPVYDAAPVQVGGQA